MKQAGRILGWSFLGLLLLISVALSLAWLFDFRQTDRELNDEFAAQSVRPVVRRYTVGQRTIRYIETPPLPGKPTIIFVHGAPSSLSFFNGFFKDTALLHRAQLVAVDRPGYGYSDFGQVEPSILRQAELLQPLIDRYKNTTDLIVVGSSYGGSVSARLAMNNPGIIDQVVFVSSALGPGLERTYGISYWVDKEPLRALVPPLLRLANDEKLAHKKALEAILPDWPRITSGITMLHGQRDELVYPTNVAFAKKQLRNAQFKQFLLAESRHDIVDNKREYIASILLSLLSTPNGAALSHTAGRP
ncbi:alpha/beta fold hydrolase [Fibrella forsythiae]|uniref:Alpha/beta fold hydrolase n=1 Tax=Fibrella forsythiae TaxID=2817061 RepID=A0ABS3JNL6_9BACT|nr:alpha/beta fold hydrolase [Fibrella forsythiae]MBO0951589.1 alpha/beta fold hydrolase [Fibrella forsythiae]